MTPFFFFGIYSLTLFGLGSAFAAFGEGMDMFGVSTKREQEVHLQLLITILKIAKDMVTSIPKYANTGPHL